MEFAFFLSMLKHSLDSFSWHSGLEVEPCTLMAHEIIKTTQKEDNHTSFCTLNLCQSLAQMAFFFVTCKSLHLKLVLFSCKGDKLCHTIESGPGGIELNVTHLTFEKTTGCG